MKIRESGMPEMDVWASFFDVEGAVNELLSPLEGQANIIEFGCGYGTFTVPVARRTKGIVTALDIDPQMVTATQKCAFNSGQKNIQVKLRDFIADGSGLEPQSQSHAMIYNLLHVENPVALLREAYRVLIPSGTLSVIHWRRDIPTPRGPGLDIRPGPEDCERWIAQAGFADITRVNLEESCPYHYGIVAIV